MDIENRAQLLSAGNPVSVQPRHIAQDARETSTQAQTRLHLIDRVQNQHEGRDKGNTPPENLLIELKRRGVVHVGTSYVVVAWVIAQAGELVGEIFAAPDWLLQAMLVALAMGLPIALVIAWTVEITADGIKWDDSSRSDEPLARKPCRGLIVAIIAILVLSTSTLLVSRNTSVCSTPTQSQTEQLSVSGESMD